jgi:hypothetical protein
MFMVGPAMSAVSQAPVSTSTSMGSVMVPGVMALVDNFEYWEDPKNQGWQVNEPGYPNGYPIWGMNIGAGLMSTVLDFQEGSRVLEVFYGANVLVPDMQKYAIAKQIGLDTTAAATNLPVLSMKFRAPVSIEDFDSYEIIVICNGGTDIVRLIPRAADGCANCPVSVPEATTTVSGSQTAADPAIYQVKVGRESEDGSWHLIRVDLSQVVAPLNSIDSVVIQGNQYRCDDITFLSVGANARSACPPYLFHINNVFTQLFAQDPANGSGYTRYIFASDDIADGILPHEHAVEDPSHAGGHGEMSYGNTKIVSLLSGTSLEAVNFAFWQATAMPATAADQNIDLTAYRNAIDAYELATGMTIADVRRTAILNGGSNIQIGLGVGGADITVDARLVYPLTVAMLTDAEMAQGEYAADGVNRLFFTASIGGAHELGTCTNLVVPLPITEAPAYYPLYGKRSGVLSILDGEPYLHTNEIATIQEALYYGGYQYWPTVAKLQLPAQQTFENMVVTVSCTDGLSEDIESFMIETVNYPVTNHPPVIEDVDDQIFYVGRGNQQYQLNATDADSFTLSAGNSYQAQTDIQDLIWTAYLDGYPSYTYGPFQETLINQKSGLISFDALFVGAYEMIVTVRDPKGAEAYAAFTIYCVNESTWMNHPPIVLGDWDHPMIGKQGQELMLHFTDIVDPDGEALYYSCNIGSMGYVNGEPVWSFQTEYPGTYMVEIVAYDMNGGYVVIPQEIVISSWWSN